MSLAILILSTLHRYLFTASSFDPCIRYREFDRNFDRVEICRMEREIDYIFNNYTIENCKSVIFNILQWEIERLFDVLDISADAFIKNRAFNVPVNFDLSPIVNFLASKYPSNKIHLIESEDPASYALYNFKSKKKILS